MKQLTTYIQISVLRNDSVRFVQNFLSKTDNNVVERAKKLSNLFWIEPWRKLKEMINKRTILTGVHTA